MGAAGLALSFHYVDSVQALVGTAYGVMVLTKAVVLAGLLVLGATNFLAVRRLSSDDELPRARLWRFVEVEVGLAVTVLFTAASLTSLPPAVDVVADRASLAEVGAKFSPRWPRFSSPPIEELLASAAPLMDLDAPRRAEEYAWSEFNHHVAGLFVLMIGLVAALERTGRARWARHWPLLFLGLASVLLVRNDPHSHAMLSLKAEFLAEVTHTPLGVIGMFVGWTRWLELRLPSPENRVPGRLWAPGLVLIGVLLLLYREA